MVVSFHPFASCFFVDDTAPALIRSFRSASTRLAPEGHFDLVATDQAGNASAPPGPTSGQKPFIVQARPLPSETPPSPSDAERIEAATAGIEAPDRWIHVPVHFHLVSADGSVVVDLGTVHRQISVLNEAFFDTRYAFAAVGADAVVSAAWSGLSVAAPEWDEMKRELARDPRGTFNVYVTEMKGGSWLCRPSPGTSAWSPT